MSRRLETRHPRERRVSNQDPSDGFIREVTEEVRQDRMLRYWKRYGPYVASGLLAIVLVAAGYTWYEQQKASAARERGGAFLSLAGDDPAGAAELVRTVDGPANLVARLTLAGTQADSGEIEAAIGTYRAIERDADAPRLYADLAALLAARLEAGRAPADTVIAAIAPVADGDGPYRLLARELRAGLYLNAGDTAAAHADLNAILADPAVTGALDARARRLLVATGGAPAPRTN